MVAQAVNQLHNVSPVYPPIQIGTQFKLFFCANHSSSFARQSLGILLGAGQISGITHEQILALINSNEDRQIIPTAGKETPVSVASHELENSLKYVSPRPSRFQLLTLNSAACASRNRSRLESPAGPYRLALV